MAAVLVIGSGGREHALAWKFKQSPTVEKVFVAPGNAGMVDVATVVPISAEHFDALANFVKENHIDLTFVGPEVPLALGIVDYFKAQGLRIFGASKQAAQLESSKSFAKEIMSKYRIPTAAYESFDDYEMALRYLKSQSAPIVLKADGLAAGKGVMIPNTLDEAKLSLKDMMCNNLFENAGSRIVIEEYLEGEEFSLMAFVSGEKIVTMPIAQDHKRAFDEDKGANTGGMGAYGPVSHLGEAVVNEAIQNVMKPMVKAMIEEGCPFEGVLYGGFMATKQGVKTIEFNVRFGDPEAEILMLKLESDLYQAIIDFMDGKEMHLEWNEKVAIGVVMAAKGYPNEYPKGAAISGLENCSGNVFHMGTMEAGDNIVTNGGRVLLITAIDDTLEAAKESVYKDIANITCDDLFWRSDIGQKALQPPLTFTVN